MLWGAQSSTPKRRQGVEKGVEGATVPLALVLALVMLHSGCYSAAFARHGCWTRSDSDRNRRSHRGRGPKVRMRRERSDPSQLSAGRAIRVSHQLEGPGAAVSHAAWGDRLHTMGREKLRFKNQTFGVWASGFN